MVWNEVEGRKAGRPLVCKKEIVDAAGVYNSLLNQLIDNDMVNTVVRIESRSMRVCTLILL
jgi:hypothetical protein